MFQLQLGVDGDQQVMRGFSRFAVGVQDYTEPFKEILKDFREIEKQQFSTEGSRGGTKWDPLAASTIADKQRNGYPFDILVRTGELRDAMTGGEEGYGKVEKLSLTVVMPWYGKYHQSLEPRSRLPRRPIVNLTEDDKTRWSKIVHEYLLKLAKKEFANLMPTHGSGISHLKSISKGM